MEPKNDKDAGAKFLHGTLEVTIFHATHSKSSFPLDCLSSNGKPTYVTMKLDDHTVAETSHERDRVWNQTFRVLCAHPLDSTITITMRTKFSVLGELQFTGHKLVNETTFISGFFPLLPSLDKNHQLKKKPPRPPLLSNRNNKLIKLQFILWFKPAEFEPTWTKLINHTSFFQGLRNSAAFPQRSNCDVIFYQDTHHRPSFQPPLFSSIMDNTHDNQPRKLWEDVYRALEDAKYLIYITGWSLNPNLVLIRDSIQQRGKGVKLGELLKRKADEGVAVRLMLWDDETSIPFLKNKGMMKTHDEDAFAYFKNTKVVCRLCPRLDNGLPTPFSHHQKTITVDTRVKESLSSSYPVSSYREFMSFIGGVDLCDGRYDTEEHSLFRTLNTEANLDDFYQTSIEGATLQKGGPREPWHDAHACVIGEAASDIRRNFEQRWMKQCDPSLLLPTESVIFQEPPLHIQTNSSNRRWNVQVFRSIDHFSATDMVSKTEQSIQEAYVEAIRRADRFIYIENQYFMGGCRFWDNDQHCGCQNLIPIEIALKVANKIRARERFAVYILIPMWPEGTPESESIQTMLHWTRETMAMMYKVIGDAIQETAGVTGHPKDYLNFFCLANREEARAGEYVPPSTPHPSSLYSNAQNSRRFMVYVHSKLMIVDDVYILMGSANINQRSMDGARDTEIAIGCYLSQEGEHEPTPDIKTYRMSLWYEHTGNMEESYQRPETLQCIERLRTVGDKMWAVYCGDEVVDMEGIHWVSYPIDVQKDGSIEDIAGWSHFPDTKASIKGTRSVILPPIFTT